MHATQQMARIRSFPPRNFYTSRQIPRPYVYRFFYTLKNIKSGFNTSDDAYRALDQGMPGQTSGFLYLAARFSEKRDVHDSTFAFQTF
jgi:hypothetical protein